jgi:hypothetical protein
MGKFRPNILGGVALIGITLVCWITGTTGLLIADSSTGGTLHVWLPVCTKHRLSKSVARNRVSCVSAE